MKSATSTNSTAAGLISGFLAYQEGLKPLNLVRFFSHECLLNAHTVLLLSVLKI